MMAFAAWRRRTTLTAAPHDSPRRLLRVGDPCTIDRGESATAAAGRALIGWWKGRMARWLGGCRACELLRILWTAGLCTRLVCLCLGAVCCFPGELAGREGAGVILALPSRRDVPRTSGRCRSRGPCRRGLRVSGAWCPRIPRT